MTIVIMNQRVRFGIILLLLILTVISSFAKADTITIAADPWMPYTGNGKAYNGYLLDVAKEIFKEVGHEVKYVIRPWSRAIKETRRGKSNAIAACFKVEAPDFIYPKNEQGISVSEIFIDATSKWEFNGILSLKRIKLGIIQDYSYGEVIDDYIKENKKNSKLVSILTGGDALRKGLQMLNAGRIDAIIEDKFVAQNLLASMKLPHKIISAGKVMNPKKLWIGFSPQNQESQKYAKILSDGMDQIRTDGRLRKILLEYGVDDWK